MENNENLNNQAHENNIQPEVNNQVNNSVHPENTPPIVNNNSTPLEEKSKNSKVIFVILLALIIVGVGGYFLYTKLVQKDDSNKTNGNNTINNNDGVVKKINIYHKDNEHEPVADYKCKSIDCKQYESDESNYHGNDFDAIIYDNDKYYIFNFKNKTANELAIPKGNYSYMTVNYDKDNKPASIIIELDDYSSSAIFSVKSNKMVIDFGMSIEVPLIDDNIDQYYLLYDNKDNVSEKGKYKVYSDKEEKIVLEKNEMIGCHPTLFYGDSKVYYINYYQHHTGGDISVEEVQSVDGTVLFKSSYKYEISGGGAIFDYDKLVYNYAVFDEKNHQIIIVDDNLGVFKIYDKNYNLIKTSKKYTSIVPYNDSNIYTTSLSFPKNADFYFVVNDNGKLNVIDYDENVIANITNVDTNLDIDYIDSDYETKTIKLYINDKALKIDDYTDTDIKRINDRITRQELLRDYKDGKVELCYEFTYNISSKKIEKNNYFYYNED